MIGASPICSFIYDYELDHVRTQAPGGEYFGAVREKDST